MSSPDGSTRSAGRSRIAVAGGSICGLCAGLALHGAGFDVQVYEQFSGPMETRGAGIVVQPDLVQMLRNNGAPRLPMTGCQVRRYLDPDGGDGQAERAPQTFTSWEAIYRTLRAAYPDERYHMGAALTGIGGDDANHGVSATIDGHGRIEADLLVCADGAQSPTRRRLLPGVQPAYAGYIAWRGTLDEANAPPDLVRFFDDAFTFSEARSGGHILAYLIPGEAANVMPGKRRLNWVWYVTADGEELARLLVGRDGRQHRASLPQGDAPETTVRALVDLARREVHPMLAALVAATPDPFLQAIVDVVVPRTVFGRVCLLGDAAFVVRPHTAGAAAKAARDATVLAAALGRAGRSLDTGLTSFEQDQLAYGRSMADHGIALGQRWTSKAR